MAEKIEDNFAENLTLFFNEQEAESLQHLRQQNSEYNSLCTAHANNSQRLKKLIESLPTQEKEFIQNYQDEFYQINAMEADWLYLQGYKDCLKLLCYLGI